MNDETFVVGTCSLCGGAVLTKRVIMAGEPNYNWCSKCGATDRTPQHGPIITMYPRERKQWTATKP